MRKVAIYCLALASILCVFRLCTGIVYGEDEAATFLVIKAPSWAYHRQATLQEPVGRKLILDQDEPALAYEEIYLSMMQLAPGVIVLCVAAAVAGLLGTQSQRRIATAV